jgi:hypothetical protein
MSRSSELLIKINELKDSDEVETLQNPTRRELTLMMDDIISKGKFDKVPRIRFLHDHKTGTIHFVNHKDTHHHKLKSALGVEAGWGNYVTTSDVDHMNKVRLSPRQWIMKYMNSEGISRHKIPIEKLK